MKLFFLAPKQFIKQASVGLVKVAQAKWRIPSNLTKLWKNLKLQKNDFDIIEDIPLMRIKHRVANRLQGEDPTRIEKAIEKLTSKLPEVATPSLDNQKFVYRGINPHNNTSDIFYGGGFYPGRAAHGTPNLSIAELYGKNTATNKKLNVLALYDKHKKQTYTHEYGLDSLILEPNRPMKVTHNPNEYFAYETPISKHHNKAVGIRMTHNDKEFFIPAADTQNIKKVTNFLSNSGKHVEADTNKYPFFGNLHNRNINQKIVDNLFEWQAGTPEGKQDMHEWLTALGRKLGSDPTTRKMLEKYPVEMLKPYLK